jgi:hypothetical protein
MGIMKPPENATLGKMEDPFEVAATMFGLFSYKYQQVMQNLDPKDLRKLAMNLATNPTNPVTVSPDQDVTDLYYSIKTALQNREDMLSSLEEKLGKLSTGQLRRLCNALVMYPLTDKIFIGEESSETLKEANNIGQRMLEAKSMMFLQTVSEYEQSRMEEKADSSSEVNNSATEEKKDE